MRYFKIEQRSIKCKSIVLHWATKYRVKNRPSSSIRKINHRYSKKEKLGILSYYVFDKLLDNYGDERKIVVDQATFFLSVIL